MITKFLLLVWIGTGQSQTLAIETFETQAECEAVRAAAYSVTDRNHKWHLCVPYTFEETK